MSFLIAGCGRSGTAYYANVLNGSGLKCGHEQFFTWDDSQNRKRIDALNESSVGESSWYAAPYLGQLRGRKVVHVVRNPDDVVASFYKIGLLANSRMIHVTKGHGWSRYLTKVFKNPKLLYDRLLFVKKHRLFLEKYTPCFDLDSEELRLYEYWYHWNKLIEDECVRHEIPYLRVNLEDTSTNIWEVCRFLGVNLPPKMEAGRNEKNRYKRREFPFEKDVPEKVLELKKRYGYS
jgi:hypothetical protein